MSDLCYLRKPRVYTLHWDRHRHKELLLSIVPSLSLFWFQSLSRCIVYEQLTGINDRLQGSPPQQ